jgi:outer membrane receptor protein involved in Fe transport
MVGRLAGSVAAMALTTAFGIVAPALAQDAGGEGKKVEQKGIEEITVTARKREETLQSVPIAVTALTGAELEANKIDDALDLQFKSPNLFFSKTNFTSSNLQIRGIGSQLVAASGEPAVGLHVNTVPLTASRLFEQEFFDIERIEVLRGPQGTLFGRNSTGGSFNIYTRKPTQEYESKLELTMGNYSAVKLNGAFNAPVTDIFRVRVAGMFLDRNGYTQNLRTNNDIDDRQLYGLRGSFQLDITDDTQLDAMVSWFSENDNRSRIGKQMCKKDARPFPYSIGCSPDGLAFEVGTSYSTLGGLLEASAFPNPAPPPASAILVPVSVDAGANTVNPPSFRIHDTRIDPTYEADELLTTVDLHHDLDELTFNLVMGYQRTNVDSIQDYGSGAASVPWDPAAIAVLGAAPYNLPTAAGNTQICLGEFGCQDRSFASDRSDAQSEQLSGELRVSSHWESPINFTAGAIYSYFSTHTRYFVYFSGAEVITRVRRATTNPTYDPDLRYYLNDTNPTITNSFGLFGEAYWDALEHTRVTLGLRYTHDDKTARSRQTLLDASGVKPGFVKQEESWDQGTGKLTIDQTLDLGGLTDSTLVFVSAARGYKPGGFNPPQAAATSGSVPDAFKPETIWAYELGTKNRVWENRVQANLTGFFYDYNDYQISKIVERTAVNENIDAFLWGLEAEFLTEPIDNALLSFSVGYLGSSIQNTKSIDPGDPTAGNPAWTTVKVVSGAGIASNTITTTPFDPFNPANQHPAGGLEKDLDGKELPNAPDVQISIAAQYTWEVPWGGELTPRVSYYWQSDMFARIFNENRDKINSWSQADASLRYQEKTGHAYIDVWVKNMANNDDITTQYLTDASSGNFTNVFVLEPRTFGITVGTTF